MVDVGALETAARGARAAGLDRLTVLGEARVAQVESAVGGEPQDAADAAGTAEDAPDGGPPADSVAAAEEGEAGPGAPEPPAEADIAAEQAVVGKEAVVTEEVRLRKTVDERVEDVEETVRHTEVDVEDGRKDKPSPRSRETTAPPSRH